MAVEAMSVMVGLSRFIILGICFKCKEFIQLARACELGYVDKYTRPYLLYIRQSDFAEPT